MKSSARIAGSEVAGQQGSAKGSGESETAAGLVRESPGPRLYLDFHRGCFSPTHWG